MNASKKNNSTNAMNGMNGMNASNASNANKKNMVNAAKNMTSNANASAMMGGRRKTRRSRGGSCGCSGTAPAPTMAGGKRKKTRRMSKGASDWNKKMMMVYREMKKKDASIKLGDAMKEAARRKQRGLL